MLDFNIEIKHGSYSKVKSESFLKHVINIYGGGGFFNIYVLVLKIFLCILGYFNELFLVFIADLNYHA